MLLSTLLAIYLGAGATGGDCCTSVSKTIIENAGSMALNPEEDKLSGEQAETDNMGSPKNGIANDNNGIWEIISPFASINNSTISNYANAFAANGEAFRDDLNKYINELLNSNLNIKKGPEFQSSNANKKVKGHSACE